MSDEKKAVCLTLENVSKVFAKVESVRSPMRFRM